MHIYIIYIYAYLYYICMHIYMYIPIYVYVYMGLALECPIASDMTSKKGSAWRRLPRLPPEHNKCVNMGTSSHTLTWKGWALPFSLLSCRGAVITPLIGLGGGPTFGLEISSPRLRWHVNLVSWDRSHKTLDLNLSSSFKTRVFSSPLAHSLPPCLVLSRSPLHWPSWCLDESPTNNTFITCSLLNLTSLNTNHSLITCTVQERAEYLGNDNSSASKHTAYEITTPLLDRQLLLPYKRHTS